MVAVLPHHRVDVGGPPVGKRLGVVVVHLGFGPHVEGLVHHQHAEAVARVEHPPAHRVVRAAQGVEAGVLQDLDAAFVGPRDGRRADHAIVVVDARPAELNCFAIDAQAALGVDLNRADAKGRGLAVDLGAVDRDHGAARVQGG